MKRPSLLDSDHVLIQICGCGEQPLTLEECRSKRDNLDQAIRLLQYSQEVRKAPNTVHCQVCGTPGKEIRTEGLDGGVLWGLPESWGWVTGLDEILNHPSLFCACPDHKEFE